MGPSVEQWVWVSDFYGFGFSDLSPRIAQTFLELSARHYPERLGAFLVRTLPSALVSDLVTAPGSAGLRKLTQTVGSAAGASTECCQHSK